ncbi:hypothetical protein ACXYMU_00810 [Pontibacter sp. CAU 1760]
MKKLLLICFCCLTLLQAKANSASDFGGSPVDTLTISIPYAKSTRAASAGLLVGTQGVGLEAQLPLLNQWQLRVGGTFLPVKWTGDYAAKSSNTVVDLNGDFSKVHLLAEWQPFTDATSLLSKLSVSGGAAYIIKAQGTANVMLKDPYQYGDIEMSPEEVGEFIVDSEWKGLAPYLGVGLNRIKLFNNVSLDVSLGAFRMPSPDVVVTGTELLSENGQNAAQLKKNFEDNRYLPSLQFGINYTFNKEAK